MSKKDEHYQKVQQGRDEGIKVRKYLLALTGEPVNKPKRDISAQLEKIKSDIATTDNPLTRVKLLQKLYNLENGVHETEQIIDLAAAEREFASVAKNYSARNGIVREVWLDSGVPESVLDLAEL